MDESKKKWLPSRGSVAGVFGAFVVFLLIGFPVLVMVLQSGGSCEGQPRPCEPDNIALTIGLIAVALLICGTWWGVRKLVNAFYRG